MSVIGQSCLQFCAAFVGTQSLFEEIGTCTLRVCGGECFKVGTSDTTYGQVVSIVINKLTAHPSVQWLPSSLLVMLAWRNCPHFCQNSLQICSVEKGSIASFLGGAGQPSVQCHLCPWSSSRSQQHVCESDGRQEKAAHISTAVPYLLPRAWWRAERRRRRVFLRTFTSRGLFGLSRQRLNVHTHQLALIVVCVLCIMCVSVCVCECVCVCVSVCVCVCIACDVFMLNATVCASCHMQQQRDSW